MPDLFSVKVYRYYDLFVHGFGVEKTEIHLKKIRCVIDMNILTGKHIAYTPAPACLRRSVSLDIDTEITLIHRKKVFSLYRSDRCSLRPDLDLARFLYRSLLSRRETVHYAEELGIKEQRGLSCGPALVYGTNYTFRLDQGAAPGLFLPQDLFAVTRRREQEANCVEIGLIFLHVLRSMGIACTMIMDTSTGWYMHMYPVALLDGVLYEFHSGPEHYIKKSSHDSDVLSRDDGRLCDELCYWDARICYEQGVYAEAQDLLSEQLKRHPGRSYVRHYLAKTLFARGDYPGSFEAYVRAVEQDRPTLLYIELFEKVYHLYSLITEQISFDELHKIRQAAQYLNACVSANLDPAVRAMALDVLKKIESLVIS